MRIGILSDTHNKLARTLTAIELLVTAGAELFIHCGDLTGPEIVQACAARPCYYVFGNNDASWQTLRRTMTDSGGTCLNWGGVIELAGKRLAVTHGHLAREMRQLTAATPDYLLFGHTHAPLDQHDGSVRFINPGALHRAEKYTVAVLDLKTDQLDYLTVPR